MIETDDWEVFNPLTFMYETKDGTKVCASFFEIHCLADIFTICEIRQKQRNEMKLKGIQ